MLAELRLRPGCPGDPARSRPHGEAPGGRARGAVRRLAVRRRLPSDRSEAENVLAGTCRRRRDPKEVEMAATTAAYSDSQARPMAGWIVFAATMMMVIGSIDFFEGLIAVIRKQYYALTPNQVIVFNMTTWGWLMMLFGI